MKQEALGLRGVSQRVGEETVLHELNLHVFTGEIFGVCTLNNVGETALTQLLLCNGPMARGSVLLDGCQVNSPAYGDGGRNPVFLIDRHSELIQNLSLGQNVFIRGGGRFWATRKKNHRQLDALFAQMGIDLRASMDPSELTPCQRCAVELIRAVHAGGRLILLKCDYLSEAEQLEFSGYVQFYARRGVTFLQFSANYAQLQRACGRIALMQNGRFLKVLEPPAYADYALRLYLRPWGARERSAPPPTSGVLRMEHVYTRTLRDYHFSVPAGQCALIAYESTAEMRIFFQLLRGGEALTSGRIILDGSPLRRITCRSGIRRGLFLIDSNPTVTMVCPSLSYLENLSICLPLKTRAILRRRKTSRSICREFGNTIGPELSRETLHGLSHEALYTLVYHRVLLYNPKAVVILQPLEDCELSLRGYLLELIRKLKRQNIAVVLLSGSSDDLLSVADHTYLAKAGRLLPAPKI